MFSKIFALLDALEMVDGRLTLRIVLIVEDSAGREISFEEIPEG